MTKPETRKLPITLGPEKSLKGFRREEVKLRPKEFAVKEAVVGKRTSGK